MTYLTVCFCFVVNVWVNVRCRGLQRVSNIVFFFVCLFFFFFVFFFFFFFFCLVFLISERRTINIVLDQTTEVVKL